MDYLWDDRDQAQGALGLELEVRLLTPGLREKGLPVPDWLDRPGRAIPPVYEDA